MPDLVYQGQLIILEPTHHSSAIAMVNHNTRAAQLLRELWTCSHSSRALLCIVFWNADAVLLTGNILHTGVYYADLLLHQLLMAVKDHLGKLTQVICHRFCMTMGQCSSCMLDKLLYVYAKCGYVKMWPYSFDLTSCDYHQFLNLKKYVHGHRFSADDEFKLATRQSE